MEKDCNVECKQVAGHNENEAKPFGSGLLPIVPPPPRQRQEANRCVMDLMTLRILRNYG